MTLRYLSVPCEFKAVDEKGTIEGFASTYGNRDQGGDIVERGAFTKSLATIKKLPMLVAHNAATIPAGVWTKFVDTKDGLKVFGHALLDTQAGHDAHAAVKAGAMTGLSIGYGNTQSEYDNARKARIIKETTLFEVSLCVFPMNPLAQITAAKTADAIKTERDFENALREVLLFSKGKARSITLHGFKTAATRWDAEATGSAGMASRFDAMAARLNSKLEGILHGTGSRRA